MSNLHFINMQNGNLVLLLWGEVDDNVNEIPNEICSVKTKPIDGWGSYIQKYNVNSKWGYI